MSITTNLRSHRFLYRYSGPLLNDFSVMLTLRSNMLHNIRSRIISRKYSLSKIFRTFSKMLAKMDSSEVPSFTSRSDRWWDRGGDFRALHAMNPIRLGMINYLFKDESPKPWYPLYGRQIMDIGCGGGILSEPLARLGAEVLGIDTLPEAIDAAKDHLIKVNPDQWKEAPFGAPEYRKMSTLEAAAQFSEGFDAVVASEVLEHVSDWKQLVSDASSCLKPGGHFIVTTINRTLPSYWLGIIIAENIIKITPKGMHTWSKFVEPSELSLVAIRNNLQPRKVLGMTYCPLSNEWSWTESQSINYAFHAVKVVPGNS
ncbi:Hexaprenyldihydroxybenzoate methyltransferase [Echinococcus granulosus]|uniref:Ubiquinone biosynthesis O-methyltransferase, mitochondrial n=1 Tax=Echinococcus granulosus TaxID=6210 RepID=W6V056_ECHGR|nr:Hexaprenyldihydroxybenzoate methyltransferase [Echinococcus granulosus]EUB64212.1 Hexaprenyldihydroxybenzoate methyltransferase [Echinococcus granulosus]